MKKITYLFLFFALNLCLSINAQETKKVISTTLKVSNNVTLTKNVQNKTNSLTPFSLTPDNQRSLNETGFVRCASVEMHDRRMQNKSNKELYEQEFENWISPLIDARKQEIAQQKANGTFQKVQVNIPIIFHVITSGGSHPTNLSQAIIQAQIDQLNIDFNNQAGSTDPVAASAEITFIPAVVDPNGNTLAEPGINRVTTFGAGPFDTDVDFELGDGGSEIKPNTIWDRSFYMNIWTANIAGGILGYAQFPTNSTLPGLNQNGGSALNDGVVCGYGTIGSVNLPGSAAPYNLGRTLTHEVGHWIGLRHIWGDTAANNCGTDYVDDTPTAATSNGGCPTGLTSCGSTDMIENYMDYTDDACMNIFTADQIFRMETVLINADGISDLPNSTTGGAAAPTISFPFASANAPENTDCGFIDYQIPVNISSGATNIANVNFTISGATGTNGEDFSLITNTMSFAAGATTSQNVTLRVFNDAFVEGDETATIDFTVNANGGDAVAGINSITLTLIDDDTITTTGGTVDVLNQDFEGSLAGINIIDADNDGNNWGITTFDQATNGGHLDTKKATSYSWNGAAFTPDNYLLLNEATIPANASNVTLSYQVAPSTLTQTYFEEYYTVYWATDASTTATINASPAVKPGAIIAQAVVTETINMSAYAGQTGRLVFRHHNCTDEFYITIDDMLLQASTQSTIQTSVNTGTTNATLPLVTSGTIYTADTASNDLMLDITNNNTFDYGCIDVSVSRAGTSAQSFNGSASPAFISDKTFTISANATSSGNTTIDFYFNAAEISGWEAATGLSRNDLYAHREGSNDIVALSNTAFGSDSKFTGTFTGLDGVYYFGSEDAFRIAVAPKVNLQGALIDSTDGLMRDDIRSMISTTSPYDATSVNVSVFNITGNNAIVDWILVELRDANTNTTVVASQSALLQRDGDVVSLDGISPLVFNQPSKNYYVAIKHRNHLSIMTANSVLLRTSTIATVDFTDATNQITFGSNAQTTFGLPGNTVAMWAGNVNGDTLIQYSGTTPDVPNILSEVLNNSGNFLNLPTYVINAYNINDVNMDGDTQYTGTTPDTPFILQNILSHPGNFLNFSTYEIQEQLPEN